jgi:hypothetical protein
MIFRALMMVLALGGLALADMSADPALAQETKLGRHLGDQIPAVPPTFDPIAARSNISMIDCASRRIRSRSGTQSLR